jgi:5-(carboxyamino)imidazole ribonucleotide synthase
MSVLKAARQFNLESKANGSLMRASALGVWASKVSFGEAVLSARLNAELTHPNPSCIHANAAYVVAIRHLILAPGDADGAIRSATAALESDDATEVRDWLENISQFGGELLIEEKVDFVTELAQLSARSPSGEFSAWPLVETHQQGGVCAEVIAPAPEDSLHPQALSIAKQISDGLGVVGVMAVELFRSRNGEILVNELAMRPHNSGHFSIDASITSQFEQHLRAVLDLPLGASGSNSKFAVMINLLGVDSENDFVQHYPKAMERFPHVKFHTYEKAPRLGRKMGHLTLQGNDLDQLLADGRACRDSLYSR